MSSFGELVKDSLRIVITYIICVAGGVIVLYELLKPFGFFN